MRKPASKSQKGKAPSNQATTVPVASVSLFQKNLPVLICLILTFLVYANTVNHEYTVDDATVISKNEMKNP